ncbi:large ribosomal subunit protein bL32m isoform X2 [Myotis daubentonii]|uniref:large ribosomal subunit protein bL32m isoform X2 n=1 Tax=Myotis daubentonii TaxID=98922 RepID=UPI002872C1BC|nr:large ribosomal subunit protein bL32m isoform X2 [Myotis daubentonii]
MLVLVVPPWPAARALLRSCWQRLQWKLQQSRPGFPSPPCEPALAVQGPAIFTESANDTNGSKEISSLLDSIFWMAAPKKRRTIEVNRCRRRNPQKLIKVKRTYFTYYDILKIQMAVFHLFVWFSSSPLCICTTSSLSSPLPKDTLVVSM